MKYLVFILMFSTQVWAGPCEVDMEKLCADAPEVRGAKQRCFHKAKSEGKLSTECSARVEIAKTKGREKAAKIKEACTAEIEKFCKNIEPGKMRIVRCLKENSKDASFSETCKASMKRKK
ncbi:MAG: hypothetical protein JNM93_08425 [Bacteriovoracaceae bacterium]|nr:hypothetical protein [Bacteriovoracaceae bacterium]